jgi:hypothetical protein
MCHLVPSSSGASASGATDDSADNPMDDSTRSDNNAVRSNRDIRRNSLDNNRGNNRPVDLRRSQSGHRPSPVAERKPLDRGPSIQLQSIFSYNRVSRSPRAKSYASKLDGWSRLLLQSLYHSEQKGRIGLHVQIASLVDVDLSTSRRDITKVVRYEAPGIERESFSVLAGTIDKIADTICYRVVTKSARALRADAPWNSDLE